MGYMLVGAGIALAGVILGSAITSASNKKNI